LRIGAALATACGLPYLVLLSQDYALLFGALLLYGLLAGVMRTTRRVDWTNI
jgi:inner membrane protein